MTLQAFTFDHFRRRGSILIWAVIFTVGVAIQTGTDFSIVQITIGRFFAGLGVGAISGIIFFPFKHCSQLIAFDSSYSSVSIIFGAFFRGGGAHVLISHKIVQWRDGSQNIERKITGSLSVANYLWVRM